MPIPFILGGIALAAGAYGAKKGYDAKTNFDEAKKINDKAQKIYDTAKEKLEIHRDITNKHLEILGELKFNIYDTTLSNFVNTFSKIKNVDFQNNLQFGILSNVNEQDILDIKNSVIEMKDIVGGGIAALGSGALAGLGALGGVSMLATASTGTAIATLSGAAATNATLAWLGGGSLAAGGFGMAGGMAVLGGIVAGPVLAVGGLVAASKAEEAKYTAYENYDKAVAAAEQMKSAIIVLNGIYRRTDEMIDVLEKLNNIFKDYLIQLEKIVVKSNNYNDYSQKEKEVVMISASLAQTIKNICDTPIIDENGEVTKKSKEVLEKSKEIVYKLQGI